MTPVIPTLDTLRANPDWASLPLFDRKGWSRVRFGDVVKNVNETERAPLEAGIDRFIGLEHLVPQDLHIRSWGNVADGTTFTRRCRPGQLLFGKRRAYQRKVAVAEFDAVVSGDIYVLTPKDKRLLPELLPFLCMSDRFFEYAVGTSAGSLSPRTNWKSLASFEFDLPPLEQQRRLANILWAIDQTAVEWGKVAERAEEVLGSVIHEFILNHRSRVDHLSDRLLNVQYGSSRKCVLSDGECLLPVLRIPNVLGGRINLDELVWLPDENANRRYLLEDGDVLIVRTNGNPDYVGRTAVYSSHEFPPCLFASYLIRAKVDPLYLRPDYLHEMLQSRFCRAQMRGFVKSSAGNYNLNTQGIKSIKIPFVDLASQDYLLDSLSAKRSGFESVQSHRLNCISTLINLLKTIIR